MPSRVVREGILDSRTICALSEPAELLYRHLINVVDDYGGFSADLDLIRVRAFPRQLDRWPEHRIEACLRELAAARDDDDQPLIVRYAVKGRRYIQIQKFNQRLRIKVRRFPGPEKIDSGPLLPGLGLEDSEPAGHSIELGPEEEEDDQLEDSLGKEDSDGILSGKQLAWFREWWQEYWLLKAKVAAEKAFKRNVTTEAVWQKVIAATRAQKPEMMSREKQLRPHGATWLNGHRWEDEVLPAPLATVNVNRARPARTSALDSVVRKAEEVLKRRQKREEVKVL